MESHLIYTNIKDSPQHEEDLHKLIENSFKYSAECSYAKDFALLMNSSNHENLHIIIDEKTNSVVAHVGALKRNLKLEEKEYPVVFFGGIAVSESYKGKGLFTELLSKVINYYKDEATFFSLWSNLDELYGKFGFHQVGIVHQSGDSQFLPNRMFRATSFKELSKDEASKIKYWYHDFSQSYFSVSRTEEDWKKISTLESINLYLIEDEGIPVGYFIKDKGMDLKDIIYEYGGDFSNDILKILSAFKVWTPQTLERDSIFFSSIFKIGNPLLFQDWVRDWSKGNIQVQELKDGDVNIVFEGTLHQIKEEDFLEGLFGPSKIGEFAKFGKPLWISGLDSI